MVEFDDNLNPLEPRPEQPVQPQAFQQSQTTTPTPSTPTPPPRPTAFVPQVAPARGSGFMFGALLILVLIILTLGVVLYITRSPSLNSNPPTTGQPEGLNVSGQATVYATPDIAKVTVAVTKNGKSVAEVKDALATVTDTVTTAVTGLDIAAVDIKTTNLSVYPQYTTNGRTITGYTGQHSLTITVRDLDKVDQVTDAATKAGANELQGVFFTVSDPEKWWKEARSDALQQAKDKAKQIAKDADIKLGRLLSVNEWSNQPWDGGYGGGPIAYTKDGMGMSGDMEVNTSPGSLELTVNVSLVYRID